MTDPTIAAATSTHPLRATLQPSYSSVSTRELTVPRIFRAPSISSPSAEAKFNPEYQLDTVDDADDYEYDESVSYVCRKCCPQFCWPRRDSLPYKEYLKLTPWEKFKRYRRIPWKFIVNVLLVLCSTTLILLLNIGLGPYTRANDANWEYILSPNQANVPAASDTFGTNNIHYLYMTDQFLNSIQLISSVYYNLSSLAIDRFEYFTVPQSELATTSGFSWPEQLFHPFINVESDRKSHPSSKKPASPPSDNSLVPVPLYMEVTRYQQGSSMFNLDVEFDPTTYTTPYHLPPNNLGPFDPLQQSAANITSYIHTISRIFFTFAVKNYEISFYKYRTCFQWDVFVTYDFKVRGRIVESIDSSCKLCPEESEVPWYKRTFIVEFCLYFIIALAAFISQVLHLRAIFIAAAIFNRITASKPESDRDIAVGNADDLRNHFKHADSAPVILGSGSGSTTPRPPMHRREGSWLNRRRQLMINIEGVDDEKIKPTRSRRGSVFGKVAEEELEAESQPVDITNNPASASAATTNVSSIGKYFTIWFWMATAGNVCNFIGCFVSLYDTITLNHFTSLRLYFIGLGALFSWITLVQYFEGEKSYYVLITTLRQGTPRVVRFIIGILPIFFGYAMLGVTLYSSVSERFATLDRTCVTLFSLTNGDAIHDVFDDLVAVYPVFSRIYLYSFVCLFIYAVLNIVIAVIEDSFFASKAFQISAATNVIESTQAQQQLSSVSKLSLVSPLPHGTPGGTPLPTPLPSTTNKLTKEVESSFLLPPPAMTRKTSNTLVVTPTRATSPPRPADHPLDKMLDISQLGEMPTPQTQSAFSSPVKPSFGAFSVSAVQNISPSRRSRHTRSRSQFTLDELHELEERSTTFYRDPVIEAIKEAQAAHPLLSRRNSVPEEESGQLEPVSSSAPNETFRPLSEADEGTKVASSSPTASYTATSSSSEASKELLEELSVVQTQLTSEFHQALQHYLQQHAGDVRFRPPHQTSYYPCGFADCAYCVLRTIYSNGLNQLSRDLREALSDLGRAQH